VALADKVIVRLSADRLLQLTNPDAPGSSARDDVRLTAAADDAEALFEIETQLAYDDTNTRHVAYAVRGAVLYLEKYLGAPVDYIDSKLERWRSDLQTVFETEAGATFAPKGTSSYVPSPAETGRPPFDTRNWDDYRIASPRGGRDRTRGDGHP